MVVAEGAGLAPRIASVPGLLGVGVHTRVFGLFLRHGGPPPKKHIHCSHCEVPRRTAAMYISQCFI